MGHVGRAARRAALFFGVLAVLAASLFAPASAMRRDTLKLVTAKGEFTINLEITETPAEMAQGLMFRPRLAENSGMLFFYEHEQEITMWMRNTYIPLDMVFIRADGTVHRIEVRTQPLSEAIIASRGPAVACLELAGGAAQRLGLKRGDRVLHQLFGTGGESGKK